MILLFGHRLSSGALRHWWSHCSVSKVQFADTMGVVSMRSACSRWCIPMVYTDGIYRWCTHTYPAWGLPGVSRTRTDAPLRFARVRLGGRENASHRLGMLPRTCSVGQVHGCNAVCLTAARYSFHVKHSSDTMSPGTSITGHWVPLIRDLALFERNLMKPNADVCYAGEGSVWRQAGRAG